MEIIGTRQGSTWRGNQDHFITYQHHPCGIDPKTSGGVVVVEDCTDIPAQGREGHCWVVDVNPSSRTFRQVIEVAEDDLSYPGVRQLIHYKAYLAALSGTPCYPPWCAQSQNGNGGK